MESSHPVYVAAAKEVLTLMECATREEIGNLLAQKPAGDGTPEAEAWGMVISAFEFLEWGKLRKELQEVVYPDGPPAPSFELTPEYAAGFYDREDTKFQAEREKHEGHPRWEEYAKYRRAMVDQGVESPLFEDWLRW